MISLRFALAVSVSAFLLVACGGSQPMTATANTALQQAATHSRGQSLHGYYMAKFSDEAGYPLPFSSLCLRFTSSGKWSSVPPTAFNGTYLVSTGELFASAIAPWSPVAYAGLQGSVNGTRGSGGYVITQPSGDIYSGGTFTLTRAGKRGC